jgi:acetyl-CoA carboxylase biotin carboxyl carrier protein
VSDRPDRLHDLTEEVLPALIAWLRRSRLGELEVAADGWRVRLRRAQLGAAPSGASAGVSRDGSAPDTLVGSRDGTVARSPGVGYFSPDPAAVIGSSVNAGDVLGQVDVLGISHDVASPADGVISRVIVEDGQAVEYGQVLVAIDTLVAEAASPADGDEAGPA